MEPQQLEELLDQLFTLEQKKAFVVREWRIAHTMAGLDEKRARGVNRFFQHKLSLVEAEINNLSRLIAEASASTFYEVLEDDRYYGLYEQ